MSPSVANYRLVRVMVREKVRVYVRVNFSGAVARGQHRKPTPITPSVVKFVGLSYWKHTRLELRLCSAAICSSCLARISTCTAHRCLMHTPEAFNLKCMFQCFQPEMVFVNLFRDLLFYLNTVFGDHS